MFENKVSAMACNNLPKVLRLVNGQTLTVHLSEIAEAARDFRPDAIVMSGTFSDFDFYNPEHLADFAEFIRDTEIPVLAICGAHQLVATAFGAELKTLDDLDLSEKRTDRQVEYQYRFIKITDAATHIRGHDDDTQAFVRIILKDDILRVWQTTAFRLPACLGVQAAGYLLPLQEP